MFSIATAKRLLACTLFTACLASVERSWGVEELPATPAASYINALREAVRSFSARDFDATLKAIDTAEAINPPSPLTLNLRGATLIEQKKFDEGADYCRKALKLAPKYYPARFNLCEVPLVNKRYPEAREMFQKMLDENPRDELVRFRILLTWLLEKNDDEARRALESIPFPGNTPAYYFGNAAWEFAHENEVEAKKWVMRGNWVFTPDVTVNFSQPFIDAGWLKSVPPASETLPETQAQELPLARFNLRAPAATPPEAAFGPAK